MSSDTRQKSPLLDHFIKIEEQCRKGHISLKEIFEIFGNDGHSIILFFLILPFVQPIPIPGLSTPLGLLMILVSIFSYLKKPPWIPKKWMEYKLSAQTVLKINESSEKVFHKVSKFIHPRWPLLFKEPFRTITALMVVLNAGLLALPLPIPFANALPAWVIFFYTIAELEDDGFFIILVYLQTIVSLFYFRALIFSFEALFPLVLKYFN